MPIKSEPRDKTPPHHMSSPPLQVYPPQYAEPNWGMQMDMQPNPAAGASQLNLFAQDMPWATAGASYQSMQPLHTLSPLSPNVQSSPVHMQPVSPHPAVSPLHQAGSPINQPMSPIHGGVSPNHMGHMTTNLVQQPNYIQMPPQNMMETSQQYNPSLSTLLMERGEGQGQNITLNSLELSSLLADRGPDLSDSLNRLTTSELQNYLN